MVMKLAMALQFRDVVQDYCFAFFKWGHLTVSQVFQSYNPSHELAM